MRDENPTGRTAQIPSELFDEFVDVEVIEGELVPRRTAARPHVSDHAPATVAPRRRAE